MKRLAFLGLILSSTLLAPLGSQAQPPPQAPGPVSCVRGGLQNAVNLYIDAQTKGDKSILPLAANGGGYWENAARFDIEQGIINKPLKIDHHRSIFDEASCQTFTEVIVTDEAEPYVLGTRMRINHDKIAEIEIVWTTTGYWLFDAKSYLQYSSMEDWGPIRAADRNSYAELLSAANAYLDAFLEGKTDHVPWGYPCQRVEGGRYFGKGADDDTCAVGVPAGVNIGNRHFVVDEVTGSVVAFCTFGVGGPNGGSGAADTHLFRVENGKLRYVHTITHLLQSSFQGAPPPAQGGANN